MRLGLATDLHLTPEPRRGRWNDVIRYDRALARLDTALAWFGEQGVDAVLVLGDLTEEGDVATLRRVLGALGGATPTDAYVVGGNHDGPLLGVLEREVRPPVAMLGELALGGVRLVGLHCQTVDGRTFCLPAPVPAGDGLLVVVSHFPLVSRQEAVETQGLNYAGDLDDVAETAARARARRGPTVVLTGHLHVDDAYTDGPLLQLVTPPVVEGAGTAAIVEIQDGPAPQVRRELRTLDGDGGTVATWRYDGEGWR